MPPARVVRGEVSFRKRVVGFEYRAIVQERSPLLLKQIKINKAGGSWPSLVQDVNALVFVGSGFGELIRPVNRNSQFITLKSTPRISLSFFGTERLPPWPEPD